MSKNQKTPDFRGKVIKCEEEDNKVCNQKCKIFLKFIYSEKATKFCKIFTLLLSYVVPVKSKGKILQNFVAFSEFMNFMTGYIVARHMYTAQVSRFTFLFCFDTLNFNFHFPSFFLVSTRFIRFLSLDFHFQKRSIILLCELMKRAIFCMFSDNC